VAHAVTHDLQNDETPENTGGLEYRYRDSNPGFRRERSVVARRHPLTHRDGSSRRSSSARTNLYTAQRLDPPDPVPDWWPRNLRASHLMSSTASLLRSRPRCCVLHAAAERQGTLPPPRRGPRDQRMDSAVERVMTAGGPALRTNRRPPLLVGATPSSVPWIDC